MLDFKKIEQKLKQTILCLDELKKYYDEIFHQGIFLNMEEFDELNRLFKHRECELNNNI